LNDKGKVTKDVIRKLLQEADGYDFKNKPVFFFEPRTAALKQLLPTPAGTSTGDATNSGE
jgi:hypothetical protein